MGNKTNSGCHNTHFENVLKKLIHILTRNATLICSQQPSPGSGTTMLYAAQTNHIRKGDCLPQGPSSCSWAPVHPHELTCYSYIPKNQAVASPGCVFIQRTMGLFFLCERYANLGSS